MCPCQNMGKGPSFFMAISWRTFRGTSTFGGTSTVISGSQMRRWEIPEIIKVLMGKSSNVGQTMS